MAQRKLPTFGPLLRQCCQLCANTLKKFLTFVEKMIYQSSKFIKPTSITLGYKVGNTVILGIEEGELWKGKHLGRMHIMQIKFQRRRNASLFAYEKSLHVYHSILHKKLKFQKLVYTSKWHFWQWLLLLGEREKNFLMT